MKKIMITCCLILLISSISKGQKANPVKWEFSTKKVNNKTYEVHLTATIEESYHIYSQSSPKGTTFPTTFIFEDNEQITLVGDTKEIGEMSSKFEEILEITIKYYKEKVDFIQKVKVKGKIPATLKGEVEYMACTDKQCFTPQNKEFNLILK